MNVSCLFCQSPLKDDDFISLIFKSSASTQYIALNVPANQQMVLLILVSCHFSNSKQKTMTQEMKIGAFALR